MREKGPVAREWRLLWLAGLIVAGAAIALLAMGRPPWCTCGTIRPWIGDTHSAENSQQIADPYTFTHVTHGILSFGLLALLAARLSLRSRALVTLAVESAWEVLENTDAVIEHYRETTLALGYYGDSVVNSMADIGACMVGFAVAARLPVWASVALVLVMEAALTLAIRDSLLLNVLMLVYPIEAIKRWQLGG